MNALRIALGIFSGKIILNFGVQKRLRAFLNPIFTGRGRDGKRQLPRWFPAETAARRVDSYAFSREKGIEIIFPNKGFPPRGEGFCSSQTVKIDFLLKKSLLSDTLNITNLIRRNEADHGCKNACPVENTV